jgi:hypothetical protein
MKQSGNSPAPDQDQARRRRQRSGVAVGVALSVAAGGFALAPTAQAEPSPQKTYNIIITDVPSGTGSVGMATNGGYLGCFPVTPGNEANTGASVAENGSVAAQWYSDSSCGSDTGHVSQDTARPSNLDNYWFQLAATKKE